MDFINDPGDLPEGFPVDNFLDFPGDPGEVPDNSLPGIMPAPQIPEDFEPKDDENEDDEDDD